MSGSGYDDSVIYLSPEGKIYQIEYAEKAVETSSTIIGIYNKLKFYQTLKYLISL